MSITAVLDPRAETNLLPANKHHYGSNNRVIGADMFRVAMTVIVPTAPSDGRADLESYLEKEHRRPGRPYGLALLESQVFSAMLLTDPAEIQAFRAGTVALRLGDGAIVYGGWPSTGHDGPWKDIIPQTTWYPEGTGVLGEYHGVDGAKVTLYEFRVDQGRAWNRHGEPTGQMINMLSWHCNRCHTPYDFDLDERWENHGPDDRQWASGRARSHARGQDGKCKPPTGEMERIVSAVASEHLGRSVDLPSAGASCAAGEGCARVRQARAVTARLTAVS